LAGYFYLIDQVGIDPHQIVFSGDSAGAGMLISMLVILRDQQLPMPAGASLISPWVDLTHSFPSIMTKAESDYIPADGFHFKPSDSWPPLKSRVPLKVDLDGEGELLVEDQIQLYTDNSLIDHPLVSPVTQGSLGGLPPMLVVRTS
jgi:acetyl esterase/lipase